MKNIDRELELKYLQIIQKSHTEWTDEEENIVSNRNDFVCDNFEITQKVINKLHRLNTKLRLEQERIFPFYNKLKKVNDKLVSNNSIDDCNINLVIHCFSNDYHYLDLDPELEGSSIYETECLSCMTHLEDEKNLIDDWQDGGVPASLRHFKHCYPFHHLYDHTCLTWFDLSLIDEIWMEIKVDYQFLSIGKLVEW